MTLREKKLEQRRAKVAKAWDERTATTKEQFEIDLSRRLKVSTTTIRRDLRAIAEQRQREAEEHSADLEEELERSEAELSERSEVELLEQ